MTTQDRRAGGATASKPAANDTTLELRRSFILSGTAIALAFGITCAGLFVPTPSQAQQPQAQQTQQQQRPNILVIFGDDVGERNISAYSHGWLGTKRQTSTASPKKA